MAGFDSQATLGMLMPQESTEMTARAGAGCGWCVGRSNRRPTRAVPAAGLAALRAPQDLQVVQDIGHWVLMGARSKNVILRPSLAVPEPNSEPFFVQRFFVEVT